MHLKDSLVFPVSEAYRWGLAGSQSWSQPDRQNVCCEVPTWASPGETPPPPLHTQARLSVTLCVGLPKASM
jgi:hypothetical protein